ncbi:DUF5696 domain-containing protein [Cohnella sp. REN36]|uniref:DUF5696 domain-containing protein n=1 Tax=Cohnella sp. REN36 TaxID=2887347 RepID=UPI001D1371B5|nr:DUF5696 domain-containing protein [Cohnella sp. REN36]MCC3371869.1 DUF5696 domain-containing protein [Cohnella sp. REN36]
MAERSLPIRPKTIGILSAALLVALGLVSILSGGEALPTPKELNLPPLRTAAMPDYEGQPWQPDAAEADAEGFVPALENGKFALRIHPQTTQIIVADKAGGYEWRSNPPEASLEDETVKGLLLSNLKSPIVLEYVGTQGDDRSRRAQLNAASKELRTTLTRYDRGIQVTYAFEKKRIRVVVQYELTEFGLLVRVPDQGIREDGEYALYSFDLLPYFGAAKAGVDGYLFVPDGPGGLIDFNASRSSLSQGYVQQIYGPEISRKVRGQQPVAFSAFGVKRGDHAYVAVVEDGKEETDIKAMPAGLKSSYYNVGASFKYREEYLRRTGRLQNPVKAVEADRMKLDRSVEYRLLAGSKADYVGMAESYRSRLQEDGRLGSKLAPVDHVPLNLGIVGGNSEEAYSRDRYVAATTFAQAADMVKELKNGGVDRIRIIYSGWQDGGDFNATKRFPIESKLGGKKAAQAFVDEIHRLGFPVLFEDNFVYVDARSAVSAKSNGARGIDGTVFFTSWNDFLLKPSLTVGYGLETAGKLKEIGVDGIHFNWLGETTFRDYEREPTERAETERLYRGLLDYARKELGQAGVYQGNDFTIGAVDYIADFPLDSNYNLIVDESVPFYPIALHGYVPYYGAPGNVRNDYEREFLKAIEYGALPSFVLTHDPARKLKNTPSSYIYSSRFEEWKERIRTEYRDFDRLSKLYDQAIVDHRKMADDVFVTVYENGATVTVDYGRNTFAVQDGGSR